jgi:hypothetical protein
MNNILPTLQGIKVIMNPFLPPNTIMVSEDIGDKWTKKEGNDDGK